MAVTVGRCGDVDGRARIKVVDIVGGLENPSLVKRSQIEGSATKIKDAGLWRVVVRLRAGMFSFPGEGVNAAAYVNEFYLKKE